MVRYQKLGQSDDVTTWALPKGAIARLGRGIATGIAFSPDGKMLAVGSWTGLWLYDISTMNPLTLLDTERGVVFAVAFSPNGELIATGNWDGDIKVWDVQNQRCVSKMRREGRFDAASQLVFSPDGHRLASSGGRYDAIYIWHPETGEQIAKFTVKEALQPRQRPGSIPIAFSPDGNLLAGATPENTFSVWDIEAGEQIACITGHSASVSALIFSPCGQFLASADVTGNWAKWDVTQLTTHKPDLSISTLPEEKRSVRFAYSANNTLLAAAVSESQTHIAVWDIEHSKKLWINANPLGWTSKSWTLHLSARCAPYNIKGQCSPTETLGLQLAVRGTHTVHLYNLDEPTFQGTVIDEHTPTAYSPHSLKFSPDGQTLTSVYDVTTLWDVASKRSNRIGTDISRFGALHFTDCETLQIAGIDSKNKPKVWEIGKQGELKTERVTSENLLWLARDHSVYSGTCKLFTIETQETRIWAHAFSPDSSQVVVALENSKALHYGAELWDVKQGARLTSLPCNKRIMGLAFSPCGNLIAGS